MCSGSWTLENYQERLELINKEKMERRQRIEEYLQKQNDSPSTDTELFNFAKTIVTLIRSTRGRSINLK